MSELYNQSAFRRFVDVFSQRTRRLIVFCGAGASFEAGLPDWDGLVKELESELTQPIHSAIGESLLRRKIEGFRDADDPWEKIQFAKDFLDEGFVPAVEGILRPKRDLVPTFYQKVWDMRPAGVVTMNLDGLLRRGFKPDRLGRLPEVYTGFDAFRARNVFTTKEPTIIELHGNINRPDSWILTADDLNRIVNQDEYQIFLRNIYNDSLVLFYGLSEGDVSVSAQLRYLSNIRMANGQYFSIKRGKPSEIDRQNFREIGIQYIYLSPDESWEIGVSNFVDAVTAHVAKEPDAQPVISKMLGPVGRIPTQAEMMQMKPDEVRLIFARGSEELFGLPAQFEKIRAFRETHDLVINHASRVKPLTDNDQWLGYQLIEEKGFGNFGKVYEATDSSGSHVAIKVAHEAVRDSPSMLDSFRRGVQSMKMLTHDKVKGVVPIIDATEIPPSIVMEFMEGISLEEAVNRGIINNTSDILDTFIAICRIVLSCHTHEKTVLHRDLRPQNVMVCGEYWRSVELDEIHVLDFDLSWYEGASGDDYYMAPGNSLGYLAPEQLNPTSKASSRSALVDVYGLTMLLFFMLSREHPQAAAPEKSNWETRLNEAVSAHYSKNWKILNSFLRGMVRDGTQVNQKERPPLSEMIERATLARDMSSGSPIKNAKLSLMEVAKRAFNFDHEFTDEPTIKGETLGGVSVKLTHEATRNEIDVVIDAVVDPAANRQNLGRYLGAALERCKDIANTIGRVDNRRSTVKQGANTLVFSMSMPRDEKEMAEIVLALGRIAPIIRVG